MSIESAKAFIERMKTDEAFAGKVTACANAQARMAQIKAAGFDFTGEEIGAVKRELTDEELGNIAAGDKKDEGGCRGGFTVPEYF